MDFSAKNKNEIMSFSGEWMEDHVKQNNPDPERQMPHFLCHRSLQLQILRWDTTWSNRRQQGSIKEPQVQGRLRGDTGGMQRDIERC